jgi:hypothetical protein
MARFARAYHRKEQNAKARVPFQLTFVRRNDKLAVNNGNKLHLVMIIVKRFQMAVPGRKPC